MLEKEEIKWEKLLETAKKNLENVPEGRLRTNSSNGKYIQYFFLDDNESDSHGKYLGKGEMERIEALAQKEYAQKMAQKAEDTLKSIRKVRKKSFFREEFAVCALRRS